jgi:hypothetical protein
MGTAIAGFHTNGSTSSPVTYGIKATSSGGTGYKQMLLDLDSRLSVLALRQAECLQKWREIAQSGRMDYQTQMQKHFNVSPLRPCQVIVNTLVVGLQTLIYQKL